MKVCQLNLWRILSMLSVVCCSMNVNSPIFHPTKPSTVDTVGVHEGNPTLQQIPHTPDLVEGTYKEPGPLSGTLGSQPISSGLNISASVFKPARKATDQKLIGGPMNSLDFPTLGDAIAPKQSPVNMRISKKNRKAKGFSLGTAAGAISLGFTHEDDGLKLKEPVHAFVPTITAQWNIHTGTWDEPSIDKITTWSLVGKDVVDNELGACLPRGYYAEIDLRRSKGRQIENNLVAEFLVDENNYCYLHGIWRDKSNVDIVGSEKAEICRGCSNLTKNSWLQNSVFLPTFGLSETIPETIACSAIYEFVKHGFNRNGNRMQLSEYVSKANEVYEDKWKGACGIAAQSYDRKLKVFIDD